MTRAARAALRASNSACVVVYVRVSSEEQAASGAGIDAQVAECTTYAERHNLTVVDVVIEDAVSGKTVPASRPGFARALALLDDCSAAALLVRRTDRVSRNLRHTLAVVDRSVSGGWSIVTTDGKLDTRTAAGRFTVNVMASAAEYERELISERTREALATRIAAGVVIGHRPELSAAVVVRIVDLRGGGASIGAIAAQLTREGVQAARGGPMTRSAVQAVLASRRVAAGRF